MKLELNKIGEPFLLEGSNSSGSTITFDASESIGGTNKGMRPMEVLAQSLAACSSIDILLMLKKQRVNVLDYKVEIVANRTEEVPAVFENIHLSFKLKADKTDGFERAVELSMTKYCSVTKMLEKSVEITYSTELID